MMLLYDRSYRHCWCRMFFQLCRNTNVPIVLQIEVDSSCAVTFIWRLCWISVSLSYSLVVWCGCSAAFVWAFASSCLSLAYSYCVDCDSFWIGVFIRCCFFSLAFWFFDLFGFPFLREALLFCVISAFPPFPYTIVTSLPIVPTISASSGFCLEDYWVRRWSSIFCLSSACLGP